MTAPTSTEIERVFRAEYGRAVSVLVRVCGDIDTAEEAVQDAFALALERWPHTGAPPSPAGWIITTARNRAVDRFRREASRDERHAAAAELLDRELTGGTHRPGPEVRLAALGNDAGLIGAADEARRLVDQTPR